MQDAPRLFKLQNAHTQIFSSTFLEKNLSKKTFKMFCISDYLESAAQEAEEEEEECLKTIVNIEF